MSLESESLSESEPQSIESSLPASSSWVWDLGTLVSTADGSDEDFLNETGPVSSSDLGSQISSMN